MKKAKEQKNQNNTGRAYLTMILLLIPIFLLLTILSTRFAQQREREQENSKRSTLISIVANERLEDMTAKKQFDERLGVLLHLMTDSLKGFVTEEGYSGPRVFEHGFVAELKNNQVILPDGIPDGEMQITRELIEESITSGKMRTGNRMAGDGTPCFLSFGKITDDFIYVEVTDESDFADYLDLYTSQSDSAIKAAVEVTGGIALFFAQTGDGFELIRAYGTEGLTEVSDFSAEMLRQKEEIVTLNGIQYRASYSVFPSDDGEEDSISMVHLIPQFSLFKQGLLQSALICFAMLLIFITAIVYFSSIWSYVKENVLNEEQAQQYRPHKIRRRFINSGLVGALVILIVALILQAIGHITVEIRYGKDALEVFSEQLKQYELKQEKEIKEKEAEWFVRYGEQLSALLSECPQLASADELQDFCDFLNIDYIMLFDSSGKETLCSKEYVGFTLEKDLGKNSGDFLRLLHGIPGIIHEPSSDGTTGLMRQLIGVKMPDQKKEGAYGALIMALYPEQIESVIRLTDANELMKLMGRDESICFAADSTTGEVILSSDSSMIGKQITDLGLSEESLDTGYIDFARLEGILSYIVITNSYADTTFFYSVKSDVMFRYDGLYAAICALLFLFEFAVVLGSILKGYDEKNFEEWAVISITDESSDKNVLERSIAKKKELKASVKGKQGAERVNAYWEKLLQLLHWDEKLPGEKAAMLFNMGFFLLLLFWLLLLFQKNSVFGEYESLAGFVLRGDWRRGFSLFCIGGILLVTTYAYFIYTVCVWLLLLIASIVPGKGETVCRLLNSVIKYASFFAVLYFSLSYLGFPVATIIASLGIVSLALSLGAQTLVADIIAGLFIVFEGSFHVGDFIVINGTRGIVKEIGIRSTRLLTSDNNLLIINNHSIDSIVNLSKKVSIYRMVVRVPSEIPLHQVEELLQREFPALKEKNELILSGPTYTGITDMGSVKTYGTPFNELQIDTDCLEKDIEEVQLYLNREIVLLFERENIKLL